MAQVNQSQSKQNLMQNNSSRNLQISSHKSANANNAYSNRDLKSDQKLDFNQQHQINRENKNNSQSNYASKSFISTTPLSNYQKFNGRKQFENQYQCPPSYQPQTGFANKYNFRGIITPPSEEDEEIISMQNNNQTELYKKDHVNEFQSQRIINNDNQIYIQNQEKYIEILNYKSGSNTSKANQTQRVESNEIFNEETQKFHSLKAQLENQKRLIEKQKVKLDEIQYNSTKNIKKFLNKTCQDFKEASQLNTHISPQSINIIPQTIKACKDRVRQFSFSDQKGNTSPTYETNIAQPIEKNEDLVNFNLTLQTQDLMKSKDSKITKFKEDHVNNFTLSQTKQDQQSKQQSLDTNLTLSKESLQVIQSVINVQIENERKVHLQQAYQQEEKDNNFSQNEQEKLRVPIKGDKINDKIKNLWDDIEKLFPSKPANNLLIEFSPNHTNLIQTDPLYPSNIQAPKKDTKSKSVERLYSQKLEPFTYLSQNKLQEQYPSFSNQASQDYLVPLILKKTSSKEQIKSNIMKIDNHIEDINILRNSLKQPISGVSSGHLNMNSNSNLSEYLQEQYLSNDEVQNLKEEIKRLADQLETERKSMDEFKERVFRRREAERKKNQEQIDCLKSELIQIKARCEAEVKKVEDQFNSYRITQNDRIKRKIEKQKQKYESLIKEEQNKNIELENTIANLNSQLAEQYNQSAGQNSSKGQLKSILKKINECEKCQSLLVNNARLVTKIQDLKTKLKSVESKTDRKSLNKTSNEMANLEPLQEKYLNTQEGQYKQKLIQKLSKDRKLKLSKCIVDFSPNQINDQQCLRIQATQKENFAKDKQVKLKQSIFEINNKGTAVKGTFSYVREYCEDLIDCSNSNQDYVSSEELDTQTNNSSFEQIR